MRLNIYVPNHEKELIDYLKQLSDKNEMSSHIVSLLKSSMNTTPITIEGIVELINQVIHTSDTHIRTSDTLKHTHKANTIHTDNTPLNTQNTHTKVEVDIEDDSLNFLLGE